MFPIKIVFAAGLTKTSGWQAEIEIVVVVDVEVVDVEEVEVVEVEVVEAMVVNFMVVIDTVWLVPAKTVTAPP